MFPNLQLRVIFQTKSEAALYGAVLEVVNCAESATPQRLLTALPLTYDAVRKIAATFQRQHTVPGTRVIDSSLLYRTSVLHLVFLQSK